MTREEAIKELSVTYLGDSERIIEAKKLAIKSLEQEPKTGHWIYDRARDWDGECKYECSECGRGSDVDYAFCQYCGAKMESGEGVWAK